PLPACRWLRLSRAPSCCCSSCRSPSTSTTTCGSWRPEARHGTALLCGSLHRAVLRHRAPVPADPGAHRLLLQRLAAGERLGWILHRLVRPAAAQPPVAGGRAAVAGGG